MHFTDSRQSTARFAASLQAASERNIARALIYHTVQDTLRPAPDAAQKAAELEVEIAKLEPDAASFPAGAEVLAEVLDPIPRD